MRKHFVSISHPAKDPPKQPRALTRSTWRDYLWGAGSVIDPLPTRGCPNVPYWTNDKQALYSDWEVVGNDMLFVFNPTAEVTGARDLYQKNDKAPSKNHVTKSLHNASKRRHSTSAY